MYDTVNRINKITNLDHEKNNNNNKYSTCGEKDDRSSLNTE